MQAEALIVLALTAIVLAAAPLGYVWRSRAHNVVRKLAWVTVFLTFDLILFGSFTRLTDSGLGCPDWPGCYGHANPVSAGEQIRAAESAQPTGPVTVGKAWVEMLHRYFAMAVGILIVVLMMLAWRRRRRDPSRSPMLATAAFVAVCLQGAFGAWTVTMKLQPAIVTAHLLGALTVLALVLWIALREEPVRLPTLSRLRWLPAAALAMLVAQIALGGWVSANYAVMACPDFPLCHGKWAPDGMDFSHGFTLWRDLGMTGGAQAQPIPFAALVAIHWTHRNFAWLVLAIVGLTAWRAVRFEPSRRLGRWLALLLALQFLTGMSNVVFQWPLVLAVMHSGGAAAMIGLLIVLIYRSRLVHDEQSALAPAAPRVRGAG